MTAAELREDGTERPEIWSEDIGVETGELGAPASDGADEGGADGEGQGR